MKSHYFCIAPNLPRWGMFIVCASLVAFGCRDLQAQVGSDSPDGVVGTFSGLITTGCRYSAYTGNITRSVIDIVVSGGVSKYPLALVRTYNSRDGINSTFGSSGWCLSYAWGMGDSELHTAPNQNPQAYQIHFPDGRSETFTRSTLETYAFRTAPGLRERVVPLNLTTMLTYLILPDGGQVEFNATQLSEQDLCCPEDGCGMCTFYWYTYKAQAIIDPFGQRTAITYGTDGRLSRVTEPAGRYIQFYYNGSVLDHITASDGRTVQYNYVNQAYSPGTVPYNELDNVVYYGQAQWTSRYKYVAPNAGSANGVPLLLTCDDPIYGGPMKRIAYQYKTGANGDGTAAVSGQILSERYWDGVVGHETTGAALSTLTIGAVGNSSIRTETRADGKTRTFTYLTGGYLSSRSDFMSHSASQTYDANMYVNSVTDENNHRTDYTSNALTGKVTQIQYPASAATTPSPAPRGTVNYTYGNASCADPNNRDANNPYYVCTATDEAGHVTQFTRDTSHRVTRIDYADLGYDTFSYNGFGQVLSHRLKTGGTETFTYDGRGLTQTYRNPSTASGNPTARYQYDAYDRVSDITDVLGTSLGDVNHTTSFAYNLRGQLTTTTLPVDPQPGGSRHTVTNAYNPNGDGTLQSKTDQLNHVWSYTYDDYRRVRSASTPLRTTYFYYDANGAGEDYQYTDSSVTWVTPPSGTSSKRIKTIYDDNRRKWKVTLAPGVTGEEATTIYGYDNAGNVTSVTDPKSHPTATAYDERNRPMSMTDRLSQTTTFLYDTGGRKKKITRPNGQTTTYDTFDNGNRVTQQTVTQTPEPNAVTQYTYYTTADGASAPVGLLKSMRDPRLYAQNCTDVYGYTYDSMGRKTGMTYPNATCGGTATSESWTYDASGRLYQFTNRDTNSDTNTQTLTYDALNRLTVSSWNDSGVTPTVTYGYDVASRLLTINNPPNANITRTYYNDNMLNTETQAVTGGVSQQVTYTYDADGNRASIQYPGRYTFLYDYTNRNELKDFGISLTSPHVSYVYDLNGNPSTATLINSTSSSYSYDDMDRVTAIHHYFSGLQRDFIYGYDNTTGNRLWTRRTGNIGDVFGYDLNDQTTAVKLNIANPSTTSVGTQTIVYDANGNRTTFSPYGSTDTYQINDLNQYTSRNGNNAVYDPKGNMSTSPDPAGATQLGCTYDAQNRLLTATKNNQTTTFTYDGLNRQVTRQVGTNAKTYNVYDGWNLIEECLAAGTLQAEYYYGRAGLLFSGVTGRSQYWVYYYQNGEGSTSQIASTTGTVQEWYWYDLHGTPTFYNASNTQISSSGFSIRHLFNGQQWYAELGLYDLRNRFYSPDIGRFIQPDPIGFRGDPTNIYRYCRNNPVRWSDLLGLDPPIQTAENVVVTGSVPQDSHSAGGFGPELFRYTSQGAMTTDVHRFGSVPRGGHYYSSGSGYIDTYSWGGDDIASASGSEATLSPVGVTPAFPANGVYLPMQAGGGSGLVSLTQGGDNFWRTWWNTPATRAQREWTNSILGPFRNGITITENGGLGEAVQQQLTISPDGVTYRIGYGPGIGVGMSVTTPIAGTGQVTGPNTQLSLSGGYYFGGTVSGAVGTDINNFGQLRAGYGFGIGFGGSVTYGQTVFVPWPGGG